MQKKEYIPPKMEVIEMETEAPLLSGSDNSWWIEKHDNNCENPWYCEPGED